MSLFYSNKGESKIGKDSKGLLGGGGCGIMEKKPHLVNWSTIFLDINRDSLMPIQ